MVSFCCDFCKKIMEQFSGHVQYLEQHCIYQVLRVAAGNGLIESPSRCALGALLYKTVKIVKWWAFWMTDQ